MRRALGTLGIAGLLSLSGAPIAVAAPAETIDICHATGAASNPFVTINISLNGLNGHGDHSGDIIPPNSVLPAGLNFDATGEATYKNGCVPVVAPVRAPAQPERPVPPVTEKIDICHATGSARNPFASISISLSGLNGHAGHSGDIIPPNSVLPAGLNFDATGKATFENGCVPVVAPTELTGKPEQPVAPVVSVTPTPTPIAPVTSVASGQRESSGQVGHLGQLELNGETGQLAQGMSAQAGELGQLGQLGMPGQEGQLEQASGSAVASNQGLNVQTAAGGADPSEPAPLLLGGFVAALAIAGLWAARRSMLRQ
ncbi:hypothetical protein ACIP9X_13220 [Arthrobacter sp. NPDC093125]|uniref:hypothetical protein n=1 Tax=Arthrobacter sp. NPDC093125 TaxID=3363944 RepID=UPI00382C513E